MKFCIAMPVRLFHASGDWFGSSVSLAAVAYRPESLRDPCIGRCGRINFAGDTTCPWTYQGAFIPLVMNM